MSRLHNPDNLIRDKDRDFLGDDGHAWYSFLCPSESRAAERHRHVFQVRDDGGAAYCTCPYAVNGGACTLILCAREVARRVRATEDGPPGVPVGAPACPECGRLCALADMDDGDPNDVWRWTCDHCEVAWPPSRLPVPPADPGGAALGPFTPLERACLLDAAVASEALAGHDLPREVAQEELDAEIDDWMADHTALEMLELHAAWRARRERDAEQRAWTEPPELAGLTECEDRARDGYRAARGAAPWEPGMPDAVEAIRRGRDGVNALDAAVAAGGNRWLASRNPAGVSLTCATCFDVRGFRDEAGALAFLRGAGAHPCLAAPPAPEPEPTKRRRPLADLLAELY